VTEVGPPNAVLSRRDRALTRMIDGVTEHAIFLLDPGGQVLTWNRGAERIKGYTAEEIVGAHFSCFYTEEARAAGRPDDELAVAVREGRSEQEGWRIRKDGSRLWASVVITPVYDDDGSLIGFGKVTRDLTAQRLWEEQLTATATEQRERAEQLEQFRLMVSAVRDYAIFMLDPGGYVKTWNAGAQRFKGYTAEEIIGQHFSRFFTDEGREADRPARVLEQAAREGIYEEEGWRVRKDGSHFWANVVVTPLRDDHNVLVGYAKVTRDLTARRAAQEELRQFTSSAAHDMREPLRTISGFAELLQRRFADELPDEAVEYLGHIGSSASRMQRLLEDLLTYARSGAGTVAQEPVVLREAVDAVLEGLRAATDERGTQLSVEVPPDAVVAGDRTAVEVVLQNLISNAVKFSAGDGQRVVVAAEPVDDGWRITIADNGPGVPVDGQGRIFDPFVQLAHGDERGTGLGLAIVRRLVNRQSGRAGVESIPGEGSTFWVVLPRAVG
jgi:PAS domain S-box-containing protein